MEAEVSLLAHLGGLVEGRRGSVQVLIVRPVNDVQVGAELTSAIAP